MGLAVRYVNLQICVAVFEYYCNQSLPELNEGIVHLWPGQPCYCLELLVKWSLANLLQYSNYPKTLATTIEGFIFIFFIYKKKVTYLLGLLQYCVVS